MLKALRRLSRRFFITRRHKLDIELPFLFLGSEYGGWPVPPSHINRQSTIYSFGIGEDITFDLAAIERFECRVLGFDPTPKSIAWIKKKETPLSFTFYPIGIADYDGEAEFFEPENNSFVSFSISPNRTRRKARSIRKGVMRLETIIQYIGDVPPDILKLDIEGFEYGVIGDLVKGQLRPKVILVEFHHGVYGIDWQSTSLAVSQLRSIGYRSFYVSGTGREYGFVFQT